MGTYLTPRFWLAFALVGVGVVCRVVPHPWNFAPIGAIALFGGAKFERRAFAIVIPLLTMLIGDAIIGFHSAMPVIYATYALIAVIGMLLRNRESVPAVGASRSRFHHHQLRRLGTRDDLRKNCSGSCGVLRRGNPVLWQHDRV